MFHKQVIKMFTLKSILAGNLLLGNYLLLDNMLISTIVAFVSLVAKAQ